MEKSTFLILRLQIDTYLTIPENSNISAVKYERYAIKSTIAGSITKKKWEINHIFMEWLLFVSEKRQLSLE